MAPSPAIHIVCSDQHRNGKTLLARTLVDYLLLEDRDPFVIDLSHPDGALRNYFPGRTALVDFAQITGQMKAFDTILGAAHRDYVIDVPVEQLAPFAEALANLHLLDEGRAQGLRSVVFFIIDKTEDSLKSATQTETLLGADLFIPVRNDFVGSALPRGFGGLQLTMPVLDPEVREIIAERRFSFRTFLLGDEGAMPMRLRPNLKTFLHSLMSCFGDISPALSLLKLRG